MLVFVFNKISCSINTVQITWAFKLICYEPAMGNMAENNLFTNNLGMSALKITFFSCLFHLLFNLNLKNIE